MTNYFYRDWKAIPIEDVPEIPKELLNYDHDGCPAGTSPDGWKVVSNESNQDLEVCRCTMFPLSVLLCAAVCGMLFAAVIVMLNQFTNVGLYFKLMVGAIGLIVVLGMPAAYALVIWSTTQYWGGPLRMRFTATNKEFFFPRENKTYAQGDYKKIVLGCVGGTEITDDMYEFMGTGLIIRDAKRSINMPMNMQYFILVLTIDGSWHRHYIASTAANLFTKRLF